VREASAAAAAAWDDVGAVLSLSLSPPATSPTALPTIAENHISGIKKRNALERERDSVGNDQPLACAASPHPLNAVLDTACRVVSKEA
jgi:hypothetical protein